MRILPSDRPFSLLVRVSYAYVRFRLNGYILFPIQKTDSFVHVKNTFRSDIDTLQFDIPPLDDIANVKRHATATVIAQPDNYEQELVNIDYKIVRKSEEVKLGIDIEESRDIEQRIIIDINPDKPEKIIKINMAIEKNDDGYDYRG